MSAAAERINALSPERRALFERMRLASIPQTSTAIHLPRREDPSDVPLSFAQQRLWFADQLHPGRCLYNEHGQLRFIGPLNLDRLRCALNEVVHRHESLRLRIPARNGAPMPEITQALDVALPCFDLTSFSACDRGRELTRLAAEQARRPFNLATGPLFDIQAIRLAAEEHILFVTMHHVICDGWSMGVLAREVAALYPAAGPSKLPPLDIQYADYAAWQRNNLESGRLRGQLDYWKRQLDQASPTLDLPFDRRFTDLRTYASGLARTSLSSELSGAIRSVAQSRGITPFAVLLSAFNVLLSRYTGQNDLAISVPVAGRGRSELDALIGVFLNVLVFRTRLDDDPSFDALLQRTQETAIAAYANQDVPFDRLIEELQPGRLIDRAPFCDVLFNFFNFPRSPLHLPGLSIERVDAPEPVARFPLTVYVEDLDGAFHIRFHYQAEIFSSGQMVCMLDQFRYLLEQATAHPLQRVGEFSLVTPAARAILPDPCQELSAPEAPPVPELIRERAQQDPQAIAIEQAGATWSYGELMDRSDAIAGGLVQAGLQPGECVAVTGLPSPELIAAMLGVFRARGVLLTLDPTLPADRRRMMLEESSAKVMLTGRAPGQEPAATVRIQLSIAALTNAVRGAQRRLAEGPEPGDPAYIFFTSGTSAVPKAVLGWHKGLSHFLTWQRTEFGIGPQDRFGQLTGLSFDVVLRDILTPLISGATLCLPDPDFDLGAHNVLPWLEQRSITGIHSTPSIAQSWVDAARHPRPLPALQHLFLAGEPLTSTLVARWRKTFPGPVEIVNLYGPTETTLAKCFYRVPPDGSMPAKVQPIGVPLPHTQALVLSPGKRLCGSGEIGEITIRTSFRSLGYRNNAQEQRRRFIPNPFRDDPADLLYRTGDLGRYRADGLLDIAGRIDDEIKIRGVRVHPAEIAATLARHPAVASAFAGTYEDSLGQKSLAAWFTVSADHQPATQTLRAWMASQLASAAVPSVFVPLKSFPLTASGKIDRRRLPVPATPLSEAVPPRDETEERLYRVWQAALHFETAGVHDNFFELGGHSLIATEVMHRVREEFHAELPLSALFEMPTIAGLAEAIRRTSVPGAASTGRRWQLIAPDPAAAATPFPLTDVQEAYWIGRSGSFELGNIATHNYSEFEFLDLDVQRFQEQFQELIRRHGMLRAMVLPEGVQVILTEVPPYHITLHDFRTCGGEHSDGLEVLRQSLSHQVLPLGQWPLFQVVVSRLDERRYRIHMSLDALICDAWSRRLLGRELLQLYEGRSAELLPKLELSFRDYVLGDRGLRDTEQYRADEQYWLDRLPTLPPTPLLPMTRKDGLSSHPQSHFTRFRSRLDPAQWRILKSRAARFGLTPSGLICAAYAEVLGAWSATPSFTINVTQFHRLPLHPQVNNIVGDFTSLLLLAVQPGPGPFEERARDLQAQLWSDLDHSLYSGVKVLRKISQMQGAAGRALMPVVLTSTLVDGQSESDELVSAWQGGLREAVSQTPQVYLDHSVSEQRGALVVNWDVIEGLFPAGLMEEMFGAYTGLLERLAREEGAWSDRGERWLRPAGQRELCGRSNATAAPQASGLLQDGFFEQARSTPENAAVLTAAGRVTYGELAASATYYAEQLRQLGAGPNQLVAVVMEKGWEQVAAVLAVVEAGAAYLPIDASLPEERRGLLLALGEARVALTQPRWSRELAWPEEIQVIAIEAREAGQWRRLEARATAADLAYVIFTSGSTGVPKGVMMEHGATLNTLADVNRRFQVGPGDRLLGLSSLSFDLSVYDIFGVLGAGGALVLAEAGAERDPGAWLQVARQHGVTLWNSVPALLEMAVEYAEGRGEELPGSLRAGLLSGDWIPVTLPGRARALAPQMELASLGGATEAAIWSIHYPIGEVVAEARSIPYGRPLDNQRFYVLDAYGEERPVWVTGQLHIGGAGLARGYWRDPERTAEQFWIHPRTGERLYRTGDLGRWLPDGDIEFLGREDAQVKLQGHRIELGEIEAALRRHPAVKDAAVTLLGSASSKRLAAYLVLDKDGELTAAQMRDYLGRRLPHYMVPSTLTVLSAVPLSGNGKVDRKALPTPEGWAESTANAALEPRDPVEEIISSTCAQLLGLEIVGVHDNLFSLGADSVMAVRLVARLEETFGAKLSLRSFFEDSTVAALARSVARAAPAAMSSAAGANGTNPQAEPLLSSAQERLWFLCQLHPESPFYNLPLALRLSGALDIEALRSSLSALPPRHEALRSSFPAARGKATLHIDAMAQLPLESIDCAGQSAAEVLRAIQAEGRRPFDLSRAPLARVSLFRTGDREHVLVLTMHHIISDAWSIETLASDLTALYAATVQGRAVEPSAPGLPYSAFARWERQCLAAGVFENDLEYWRTRLAGAVPLELRTSRPRQPSRATVFPGARQTFTLPANLTRELQKISRDEGSTLFMTLLAAFSILLHRDSGQNDIVIATSVSNRNSAGFEDAVGCFLNTVLLRVRLSPGASFRELLASVRESTAKAYAHQNAPFEEVVRRALPDRDLSHALMSRCVFGLRTARIDDAQVQGLEIQTIAPERGSAKFDIELQTVLRKDGLTGFLDYNRDLFDADVISRMLASFEALLTRIAADPAAHAAALAEAIPRSLNGPHMEMKTRDNARKSLHDARVRPVTASPESLVRDSALHPDSRLPLLVEPNTHGVDLTSWLTVSAGRVRAALSKHGAVLFRNFGINSVEAFEAAVGAYTPDLMKYTERSTPRSLVSGNIYTSTEYPADRRIPMHNENSYSYMWPRKLWFYCVQPALEGGETPLADSRLVYQRMDPDVRARFEEKQVMYLRNYRQGLGLSWQESFQTDDPAEVERYCAAAGMTWEWLSSERLRTRHVRPATARHPESGEPVWFNQANLFQMASVGDDLRASMERLFSEEDLPRGACYGDGSRIEPEALLAIDEAYRSSSILIPWRQGDVLLVDNMLSAHGREPFRGARKVVVALAEPSGLQSLQ